MNDKIIFFNTGWMDFYEGLKGDTITGGGKHVDSFGWGGEMFNFKNYSNKLYGFVQPKIDKKYHNPCIIKLEKIGGYAKDEKLKNVTVVWTAKDPDNGGTYIIGWYKNATVYRYEQSVTKKSIRKYKNYNLGYFATTKFQDGTLLPKDQRNVRIHRQEKGWFGQSNVWYADQNPDFVKIAKDYIFKGKIPAATKKLNSKFGMARQPDLLKRIEVEKCAVKIVSNHYRRLGYIVESFEKDNLGWDLKATNYRTELKLEVKGLSGNDIFTELTPNEYKNLKADNKFYRLCIVSNALTRPKLAIFSYSIENNAWTSEDGMVLIFDEVISARVSV
jgi:hypothetical protein